MKIDDYARLKELRNERSELIALFEHIENNGNLNALTGYFNRGTAIKSYHIYIHSKKFIELFINFAQSRLEEISDEISKIGDNGL